MKAIDGSSALALIVSCGLVGATAASAQVNDAHDREIATASMMRTCVADVIARASDLKLSAEGVQDYCRCFAAKIGSGIPLAELKGPATPKFDALASAAAKECYLALPAGVKR